MLAEGAPKRKTFVVVRPYPARIRQRVFGFLEELGFESVHSVEVGTPDAEAARCIRELEMDLLLLPYHKHKASDGEWVSGLGVLSELGDAWAERGIPILMPVDEFTFAASFERERRAIDQLAPRLPHRLVVMRESEIGSDHVVERIERARGGSGAFRQSSTTSPSTPSSG